MEPEIERAIKRAGLKLGGGLLLLAAVIGLRVVAVSPDFVEDEVAKLALVDLEAEETTAGPIAAGAGRAAESVSPTAPKTTDGENSVVSRLGAGVKQRLGGRGSAGSDAERMVSCEIAGRIQFTRAADCAARGGRSSELSPQD